MNSTSQLSWAFVGVVGLSLGTYLLMAAAGPTPAAGFDLNAYGEIPVTDHGRVKPFDTLARINLMIISGKQTYTDEEGNTQPAVRWLLDVMTAAYHAAPANAWDIPGKSRKVKAYRIDNAALRAKLRLEGGPVFSYEEIVNSAGKDRLDEMRQESEDIQARHKDLVKNQRQLLKALSEQDRALRPTRRANAHSFAIRRLRDHPPRLPHRQPGSPRPARARAALGLPLRLRRIPPAPHRPRKRIPAGQRGQDLQPEPLRPQGPRDLGVTSRSTWASRAAGPTLSNWSLR